MYICYLFLYFLVIFIRFVYSLRATRLVANQGCWFEIQVCWFAIQGSSFDSGLLYTFLSGHVYLPHPLYMYFVLVIFVLFVTACPPTVYIVGIVNLYKTSVTLASSIKRSPPTFHTIFHKFYIPLGERFILDACPRSFGGACGGWGTMYIIMYAMLLPNSFLFYS